MSWRRAVVDAAECAACLGQYECVGRLLAAGTPREAYDAAHRTESAAAAIVAAVTAMHAHRCGTRDMRLLAEAADLVRRVAFAARIACLLAERESCASIGQVEQ